MSALNVLLVDDSPDCHVLVAAYLQKQGHNIEIAENGFSGLMLFKHKHFDVVLMDCDMPVMNGDEAVLKMRRYEAQQGLMPVPIVALTGFDARETKVNQVGFTLYLKKPICRDKLLAVLNLCSQISLESKTLCQDGLRHISPDVAALVPEFMANRRNDCEKLDMAFANSDYKQISIIGHNLHGISASYGFDELTELGKSIEFYANNCNHCELERLITVYKQIVKGW